MIEQPGETNCVHGVGHKDGIHGCDGCCAKLKYPCEKCKVVEAFDENYAYCQGCNDNEHFINALEKINFILSPNWVDRQRVIDALIKGEK